MLKGPLFNYGVNEGMTPRGGWFFEQEFLGSLIRIPSKGSAQSSAHIVQLVTEFRIKNAIDIDGVAADVASQTLARSPINKRWNPKAIPSVREKVPQIKRVKEHIEGLIHEHIELVPDHQANERAKVCINCPQNIKWKSDCGGCNTKVEQDVFGIRRLTKFGLDAGLRSCRLTGHHLGLSVFLTEERLPKQNEKFPEKCWIPKAQA